MSAWRDRSTVHGFRAAAALTLRLPAAAAYRLYDRIARRTYRANGRGVQHMRAAYARLRPELSAAELEDLVLAGVRSYCRYWCDVFRLARRGPDQLAAEVVVRHDTQARADLARGEGFIGFLGHCGNWDTAGAWATHYFAPVTTVAERLKPEELYEEFLAVRERLGMRILPLTGGSGTFVELLRTIRSGGFVPLLADRDLSGSGVPVSLAGQPARMAPGPAALAVATGAPLYVIASHYEPDPGRPADAAAHHQMVLTFHGPIEVPTEGTRPERIAAATQACADALGQHLREHTEDWHMMQRYFVEEP